MPEGWVDTQLGNIIELKYGKSLAAQTRDGFGFPVYGSNGVVGKHSIPLINKSGLIVGRKGSYGVVNKSAGPFFPIDTTYYIDDFYNQPLEFLFYYLSFLPLTKLNRSTAIPGLNRDDAYDLNIALPPLAEQKIHRRKTRYAAGAGRQHQSTSRANPANPETFSSGCINSSCKRATNRSVAE